MEDIAKEVGKKIRSYRKQMHLTIEDLAEKIGKSKSTVAKYEAGSVAIDIYTINDLAEIFHIPAYQLLFVPKKQRIQEQTDIMKRPFNDCDEFFLYYYDGRYKRIVKSYMRILFNEGENSYHAYYYLGINSYENYTDCEYVYEGTMQTFDFITYFHLSNLVNPVDKITISTMNPLHQNSATWGIFSGILSNPISPFIAKVLISKNLIADSKLKAEELMMTKEELRRFKSQNLLYLKHLI